MYFPKPYSYNLPLERIAQRPVEPRDSAKLLVSDPVASGGLHDSTFAELPSFLRPGDLLVFNDTKVLPARLRGKLEGGDARCELLPLREVRSGCWQCLGSPLKKLKVGRTLDFGSSYRAEVVRRVGEKLVEVIFFDSSGEPCRDVRRAIESAGVMPIPPYIRRGEGDAQDIEDYQTIFAKEDGSVAAPTASLHFTKNLLARLSEAGIASTFVTLHVGPGSFLPINEGALLPSKTDSDSLFAERCCIPLGSWQQIQEHRESRKRVIAVGTTVVRALEGVATLIDVMKSPFDRWHELNFFVLPGHKFRAVDALITNFHQPGTTHLLLVEALIGRRRLSELYSHALSSEYRFLSYGDGMLLQPK